MARKILIAAGDSWTDKNFTSDYHPKLDTSWPKWPELVGSKLGMEVVNIGKCGQGNHMIYHSLLDTILTYDPKDIGYVMIGWSQAQRYDFEMIFKYHNRYTNKSDYKFQWSNERVKPQGHILGWIRESLRYFYSIQTICASQRIPLKQFQMIQLYSHYYKQQYGAADGLPTEKERWGASRWWNQHKFKDRRDFDEATLNTVLDSHFYKRLSPVDFIGIDHKTKEQPFYVLSHLVDDYKKYRISEEDAHPNAEGQKILADYIYENL